MWPHNRRANNNHIKSLFVRIEQSDAMAKLLLAVLMVAALTVLSVECNGDGDSVMDSANNTIVGEFLSSLHSSLLSMRIAAVRHFYLSCVRRRDESFVIIFCIQFLIMQFF